MTTPAADHVALAVDNAAAPSPQALAAAKLQEVMRTGTAFVPAQWAVLERFASEKAREARSERLKRTTAEAGVQPSLSAPQRRRTVRVVRRHSAAPETNNT